MIKFLVTAICVATITGCTTIDQRNGEKEQNQKPDTNRYSHDKKSMTDPAEQVMLGTRKTKYGKIIVDAGGQAVYSFSADEQLLSTCAGKCSEDWPPVMTENPPTTNDDLDEMKVAAVSSAGGQMQVAYNGMPLYFNKDDTPKAGTTKGHAKSSHGGRWSLVSSSGKPIS